MTRTPALSIPGFAAPWSTSPDGLRAHAYPTASTFSAALEGFKRKRKSVMFHMLNTGEAGAYRCAWCDGRLDEPYLAVSRETGEGVTCVQSAGTTPDKHSTWHYDPATKDIVGGVHYICSWQSLMGRIHTLARQGRI